MFYTFLYYYRQTASGDDVQDQCSANNASSSVAASIPTDHSSNIKEQPVPNEMSSPNDNLEQVS